MKQVNRERKQKQADVRWGPKAFRDWFHTQPCWVCGARPVHQHHHPTWGARGSDWTHTSPLCRRHHNEYHAGVKTFEAKYGSIDEQNAKVQRDWVEYLERRAA